MNNKLNALLMTAITTGLFAAQAVKAEDKPEQKGAGSQVEEKNGCEGHKAGDKNSCKGKEGKKKAKGDKNSCKNGCGEAKEKVDGSQKE